MRGLRKLYASVRTFFQSDEIKHIEQVSLNFLARAGLGEFIKQYEQLGIAEFQKLATVHNTEDVKVFVDEAKGKLLDIVKSQATTFHNSWFEMLFSAIVENWQATKDQAGG